MRLEDASWTAPPPAAGSSTTIESLWAHAEHLGAEDELRPAPAPRRARTWFDPPRLLSGLVAAGLVLLVASLLWPAADGMLIPLTVMIAAAGILAAAISREVTRREIRGQMDRFRTRIAHLFPGGAGEATGEWGDLQTTFDNLTRSVETTLEGRLRRERDAFLATITSLVSALEARDPYTRNHSNHVAKLGVRLAHRMGLDRDALYEIHLGGLLHDVGKIGIRDDILLKPAGLTRDEYEIMKTHPALGARILSGLPGFEGVRKIVLYHHEMYDGRGYPDGLQGKDIPLGARIIGVADTYLSLVEDRPYRRGRDLGKVTAELRRVAGRQLDPDVVEALFDLMDAEAREGRGLFVDRPEGADAPPLPEEREAA